MKYLILLPFILGCAIEVGGPSVNMYLLKWPTLPVLITPSMDTFEENKLVVEATAAYNEALDMEVFRVGSNGVIVSRSNQRLDLFTQGKTYLYSRFSSIYKVEVEILPLKVDLKSLLIHELGHVLGLRHSDDGYYNTMSRHLGATQVRVHIDDWTKEEIRKRYGRY